MSVQTKYPCQIAEWRRALFPTSDGKFEVSFCSLAITQLELTKLAFISLRMALYLKYLLKNFRQMNYSCFTSVRRIHVDHVRAFPFILFRKSGKLLAAFIHLFYDHLGG
jgi:hypothetical protein